jgi:hypothetical protein
MASLGVGEEFKTFNFGVYLPSSMDLVMEQHGHKIPFATMIGTTHDGDTKYNSNARGYISSHTGQAYKKFRGQGLSIPTSLMKNEHCLEYYGSKKVFTPESFKTEIEADELGRMRAEVDKTASFRNLKKYILGFAKIIDPAELKAEINSYL